MQDTVKYKSRKRYSLDNKTNTFLNATIDAAVRRMWIARVFNECLNTGRTTERSQNPATNFSNHWGVFLINKGILKGDCK